MKGSVVVSTWNFVEANLAAWEVRFIVSYKGLDLEETKKNFIFANMTPTIINKASNKFKKKQLWSR